MPQPIPPILEALKLVMITDAHKLQSLLIPIRCFFRRKQDSNFTPWREVVHSGNINRITYTRAEIDTKFDNISTIHAFNYGNYYSTPRYFKLGILSLPKHGHHAVITVNPWDGEQI